MAYDVKFSPKSKKFLKKLEKEQYYRVVGKFKELKKDPFRYLGHFEGQVHKFRIGNYRVLIDFDSERKILWVRVLDKRGRVYKR
ncbi:MAG: type II toxin-antitoxin system RelE/ParE family toxin [Candidatus Pacearchaeota archaeon]